MIEFQAVAAPRKRTLVDKKRDRYKTDFYSRTLLLDLYVTRTYAEELNDKANAIEFCRNQSHS